MRILRISSWQDLQPYRQQWDALAGDCLFRNWTWQATWWRYYAQQRQLMVLLVFADESENASCQVDCSCVADGHDAEDLRAILPCYVDVTFARGKVLRLVGDGEVCSDYLDILAKTTDRATSAAALADYLNQYSDQWDSIDFTAIGADCLGLSQLSDELGRLGCHVSRQANENRWSVPLPEDWEAFLALQSKSHRKQLRRLERRVLDSEQATWHLVESPEELDVAWPILIDLHQRRRVSLGQPGCFASQRWSDFHRDVARQLLDTGQLRLSWLEIAGQPVAAEYHFAGSQATLAYQGGVDPGRLDEEPGRLSMIRTFQHAIDEGHSQFDLLRGDEPYKAHWRAEPTETFDIEIVPTRSSARWRHCAFNYVQRAARVARQITNMLS